MGTRQFGLFRASAYFGHQGSQSSGFSPAGGDIYEERLPLSDCRLDDFRHLRQDDQYCVGDIIVD